MVHCEVLYGSAVYNVPSRKLLIERKHHWVLGASTIAQKTRLLIKEIVAYWFAGI